MQTRGLDDGILCCELSPLSCVNDCQISLVELFVAHLQLAFITQVMSN